MNFELYPLILPFGVLTLNFQKLPRSFYTRPTLRVAKDLLGKILVRKIGKTILAGKIVEVEAYLGSKDPASHAYRGQTKRNEVMFREGGHLYVYFTYGMHFCANVVTGREGIAEAVLVRGVEPLEGIGRMKKNRGLQSSEENLTNGPAKFCQAFDIGREQNGADLLGKEIFICDAKRTSRALICTSTRIGITNAQDRRWRFFIRENKWVSKSKK
ncbi:MAG TPA: DNA-3-methyladenine glycosylase [Bacteroidota bacterium]|nr:DNA-3-methyladenine glycosylase [Bacteroidota bacterium]